MHVRYSDEFSKATPILFLFLIIFSIIFSSSRISRYTKVYSYRLFSILYNARNEQKFKMAVQNNLINLIILKLLIIINLIIMKLHLF